MTGMTRTLLSTLAVIWLALTLSFVTMRILPGDAVTSQLVGAGFDASAINVRRESLGMNDPLGVQYVRFWRELFQGDLGLSLYSGETVVETILPRASGTLAVALVATLWLVLFTVFFAWVAAQSGLVGKSGQLTIAISLSVPSYVTGTLAVLAVGLAEPNSVASLVTAACVLGFHTAGPIAQVLTVSVRETRSQVYVTAARARGLLPRQITFRHTLPNAILSIIPSFASQVGFLFSGTVITEVTFARPGLGRLMLDSVLRRDIPVVQGLVLFSALSYAVVFLISEALARYADPRPRL